MQTYEQIRSNQCRPSNIWLGLLNVILALAESTQTELNPDYSDRMEHSNVFYRRCIVICGRRIWHGTSLESGRTQYFVTN